MENDLVKVDVVPKFEISLEAAKERLEQMDKFIADQMVKGTDYGTVPGINKPTLFKSGAEKLENIFGFYHEFEALDKQEEFEKGKEFAFYRYKCIVYQKSNGIKQAEGIGSANTREPSRRNQDFYNLLNTVDKMAQKRAFVAAILSSSRLSNKFTQDVEDMKESKKETESSGKNCVTCDVPISSKVAEYSMEKLGKHLCFKCQKNEKEVVM